MLLANNMLHFGSVKISNEIVVLYSSCHNFMMLYFDFTQLHQPHDTTYILEASHWSPGVLRSVALGAFRMKKCIP